MLQTRGQRCLSQPVSGSVHPPHYPNSVPTWCDLRSFGVDPCSMCAPGSTDPVTPPGPQNDPRQTRFSSWFIPSHPIFHPSSSQAQQLAAVFSPPGVTRSQLDFADSHKTDFVHTSSLKTPPAMRLLRASWQHHPNSAAIIHLYFSSQYFYKGPQAQQTMTKTPGVQLLTEELKTASPSRAPRPLQGLLVSHPPKNLWSFPKINHPSRQARKNPFARGGFNAKSFPQRTEI